MIHVSEPLLDAKVHENVLSCVTSGWISSEGEFIQKFEQMWANYCGMNHGVAVSNGTTALQLALQVLDLKPGDEVIVPSFTIISCVTAIIEAGGTPVLVDSEPDTWCMNVAQVQAKISSKTRAIMPVHMYGHPVDMDPILSLAKQHKLIVIEDAAEAHGAEYNNKKVGGLSDISCFSFYANKIITTGEGGMVLTKSPVYAERLRSLRNLAFKKPRRFVHDEIGHNYRLTNLQAAVGCAQVEKIEHHVALKRATASFYNEHLSSFSQLQLPVEKSWAKNVYWMYALVLDKSFSLDATQIAQELYARGVETRPFFWPMHEQPVFHARHLFQGETYPVAENIARRGFYLPSGLQLNDEKRAKVCQELKAVLKKC